MRNQSLLILGASLGMAMGPSIAQQIGTPKTISSSDVTTAMLSGRDMSTTVTVKAKVLPACTFTTDRTSDQTMDFGEISKLGSS